MGPRLRVRPAPRERQGRRAREEERRRPQARPAPDRVHRGAVRPPVLRRRARVPGRRRRAREGRREHVALRRERHAERAVLPLGREEVVVRGVESPRTVADGGRPARRHRGIRGEGRGRAEEGREGRGRRRRHPGRGLRRRVVVATEPTELVVTEGKPALKPVAGTDGNLLAVDNTEGDVLFDVSAQDYYVLLSGRWFKGKSLSGNAWTYVPPEAVPASFTKIPPESDSGDVRAAVAGTDEAEEAVLDAQIPQTTAVKRAEATLEVQWDGEPNFIPIESSSTAYALNASTSVLRIRNRYYACENAVWFVSDSPDGAVVGRRLRARGRDRRDSAERARLQRQVRAHLRRDAGGRVRSATRRATRASIRGTARSCGARAGITARGSGPTYWWPRPYTWGLSAHYNPWTGWGFGYSWSYPFFSVSFGWGGWFRPRGWYRPAYGAWGGGWHRPGGWGWYGPGGYRPPAVIAGNYWGAHGGGSWNRPLPNARPGAVRPAIRPVPGVRPGIGFRPPARDIRQPAPTNVYNRLPANVARRAARSVVPSSGRAPQRGDRTTSTRTRAARSTGARVKASGSSGRPAGGNRARAAPAVKRRRRSAGRRRDPRPASRGPRRVRSSIATSRHANGATTACASAPSSNAP